MISGDGTFESVFRARLAWLRRRWGWKVLRLHQRGNHYEVMAAMSPLRPLPLPEFELALEVKEELVVTLKTGTSRIRVGDVKRLSDPHSRNIERSRDRHVEDPWYYLEGGAVGHYRKEIASAEGLSRVEVDEHELRFPNAWSASWKRRVSKDPTWPFVSSDRAKEGETVPDAAGVRLTADRKVDLISLFEASMVADMSLGGRFTDHAGRKRGQLLKYVDGLRLARDRMRAAGTLAPNVEFHLHYLSTGMPDPVAVRQIEDAIKSTGLPRLTFYWHKV
jgi:hypothetical protein